IAVGMCGWVLQNEKSLFFGESSPFWLDEGPPWEEGQQSAILVPLFGKKQIIGGLSALGKKGGGSFSLHDLDLLTMFANQVSIAIENATLFHQLGMEEEALRITEERLSLALKATGQGIYDLDLRTGDTIVSPEYALMLGYDTAEFHETDAKWIERLHPDDKEQAAAVYRAYVNGEIPEYKVEFRQKTKDGTWKWILSIGKIMERDVDGNPLRMIGTFTDITDRKKTEAELRLKRQQLEELNATLEQRVREETASRQEKEQLLIQQSRMAAMGEMIGAIAHQWRQPLNVIGLIIQNLQMAFEYSELNKDGLKNAVATAMWQVNFMSKTIDDFRNFFKPSKEKELFE